MNDRELLELAAKAAGIKVEWREWTTGRSAEFQTIKYTKYKGFWVNGVTWNPLTDDGDALRLAVKLRIMLNREINCGYDIVEAIGPERNDMTCHCSTEPIEGDPYAATRRAIVRAAAEIGRNMK